MSLRRCCPPDAPPPSPLWEPFLSLSAHCDLFCAWLRVRKKTLNPEWNETFVFCVKHVGQRLCLECFDWDKFTKDDPMGLGVVEITAALTEETPVTVTLTDVKSGSIDLALTLTMLADDEG